MCGAGRWLQRPGRWEMCAGLDNCRGWCTVTACLQGAGCSRRLSVGSAALGRSIWRRLVSVMRAGGKSVGCRLLRGREGRPKQSQASWESPSAWDGTGPPCFVSWASICSKFHARKCSLLINTVSASLNHQGVRGGEVCPGQCPFLRSLSCWENILAEVW